MVSHPYNSAALPRSLWLYDVKSQNSVMTMYSLHSNPPHSPCHYLLTTAASQMSRWLSCGRCWMLSGIVLGVTMKKISPNSNTAQFLQILPSTQLPNASIVLTLVATFKTWLDCFGTYDMWHCSLFALLSVLSTVCHLWLFVLSWLSCLFMNADPEFCIAWPCNDAS